MKKCVLLFFLSALLHCHAQSECENCTTTDKGLTTPDYEDYEVENTTSLIEPAENTTVTNSTVQPNNTTLLPLDPITTPAPHFPSRHLEPVPCTCDLLVDVCDIDCCCDVDCSLEDRKVFSHCVLHPLYPPEPRLCQYQNHGGLLCLYKDNVPQRYWLQHPNVITALNEFNKFESRSKVFPWPSSLHVLKDELVPGFPYKSGSLIWTLKNNKTLRPLKLYMGVLGSNCDAEDDIAYLKNWKNHCTLHLMDSCKASFGSVNSSYFQLQMLSNPMEPLINQSEPWLSVQTMICSENCSALDVPFPTLSGQHCNNAVVRAKYEIQHNGTEGIVAVKLLLWLATIPMNKLITQHLEVEFLWIDDSSPLHYRSGRPGYIPETPILAGLLSEGKDTVMPLGTNSWLAIPSSGTNGKCELQNPVLFKENILSQCNVEISTSNFTRLGCTNLSLAISSMLLANVSNLVIGAFGDSEWGSLTDWLPVISKDIPIEGKWIDGVRENRTQKSDSDIGLCGGVSTNMNIHFLWSTVGSLASPQSKILGVKVSFSPTQTLKPPVFGSSRFIKLGVSIKFTDVTLNPQSRYAPPPKYEIRLPKDFFYPLFSSANKINQIMTHSLCMAMCLLFLYFKSI